MRGVVGGVRADVVTTFPNRDRSKTMLASALLASSYFVRKYPKLSAILPCTVPAAPPPPPSPLSAPPVPTLSPGTVYASVEKQTAVEVEENPRKMGRGRRVERVSRARSLERLEGGGS